MKCWKPLKGWEGIYEIDENNMIRSLDKQIKTKHGSYKVKGRELTPIKISINTFAFNLKDGKKRERVFFTSNPKPVIIRDNYAFRKERINKFLGI